MQKAWEFLNGKKTVIAALAGLALSWAQAKGYVDGETAVYLATALTLLTGVAVGHKVTKAQ
jgi:hypothetical protein